MSTEATSPTGRAGALVYRIEGRRVHYLLVSAKVDPNFYIVPQGKIKAGEAPEAAARRETLEEAGVEIAVVRRLGAFQHELNGRRFDTEIYLASFLAQGTTDEGRTIKWATREEAGQMNIHPETLAFIRSVDQELSATAG